MSQKPGLKAVYAYSGRSGKKHTNQRRAMKWVFFMFLFLILLSCEEAHASNCIVEKAYDGDTLLCSEEKIRLIGVDTPESSYNFHIEKQRSLGDNKTIIALGKRAKKFTQSLIPPGTKVRLEFDVQVKDPFGRTLAYVWLPDGRMLNEALVQEGYAMASTYPPNIRYEKRFKEAYRYAIENNKGLWGESASQPQVTLASNKTSSDKGGCPADKPIKGNINSKGEKIYHLPGGVFYKRTEPEECFATEQEAQRGGFRRSSR